LTEESHVQKICFVSVGDGSLFRGDESGNEVCLDGVGVDAVVKPGNSAIEVPREGETAVFIVLETLEFLD
jgi:hypothetical protein